MLAVPESLPEPKRMTLHTQVILILLFGLAILYVLLGTSLLIDRRAMMALPPERRGEAITYTATFAAAIGLACTAFGVDYLIFGSRQPSQLFTVIAIAALCLFILGRAILRKLRARSN
jgi:hypothetical protein